MAAAIDEHKRYLVGKDPGRHRNALAGHVSLAALARRADSELRHQRRRDRAVGHPRPGAGPADLEAARRQGARSGADVRARRRQHAAGVRARTGCKAKEEGWTGCKAGFITTQGDVIDPIRSVREGIANLKAVREAVGEDFRICIDLHGKTTPTMAIDFCRRAEEYSPYFVEEATQIEDLDELALLRSKTRIPLATGERLIHEVRLQRRSASGTWWTTSSPTWCIAAAFSK